MPCSTERQVISDLQELARRMEDELSQWKDSVKLVRQQFYELNYFNTMQLLTLRRELGKLKDSSGIVSPGVLALLQSISADVTPKIVSTSVCHVTEISLPELVVTCEDGDVVNGLPPPPDMKISDAEPLSSEDKPKKDYSYHQPTLTEEHLNEAQKEIMTNICSRLNCSKQLVLFAFEKCPGDEYDRYDYQKWCLENMDLLDESDAESCDSDSGMEASSDSDDSVAENHQFKYSASKFCMQIHLYSL